MAQTQTIEQKPEAKAGEELLRIEELHATVEGREILKGISLVIKRGETHAVMGPNGSGKSTLAYILTGRPGYEITKGRILYKGEDIAGTTPDARARSGMFLAFQYPQEIPGVSVVNFLRTARNAVSDTEMSALEFHRFLKQKMALLDMPEELVKRYVNAGFSGGEKKRNEILQMAVLEPDLAVLDETDSGLDIDALRAVAEGVKVVAAGNEVGVLLITHYQRILNYITPDVVHVLVNGKIVKSGGPELAAELEKTGYDAFREEAPAGDKGPLP
ncbi:MAG: Fe-S cluster assembly ATPase SufC [Actinomycetota bacterium]|nr:Fe-S cluster assembly ATPase SufC [Actinomycetota bacterium]